MSTVSPASFWYVFLIAAPVGVHALVVAARGASDRRAYARAAAGSAALAGGLFAAMVAGIRDVERALGSGVKKPAAAEREVARVARRSVVAAVDIPRGARITARMLACKRPGTGIPPSRIGEVVGRRAARLLAFDHVIAPADLA